VICVALYIFKFTVTVDPALRVTVWEPPLILASAVSTVYSPGSRRLKVNAPPAPLVVLTTSPLAVSVRLIRTPLAVPPSRKDSVPLIAAGSMAMLRRSEPVAARSTDS